MQHPELTYYSARAREYERVYAKPERQAELKVLRQTIPVFFTDRSVLEVACGTGYWTRYIAGCARSVCATDLSETTLAIAREKGLDPGRVRFQSADAMDLPPHLGCFEAAFCGFCWSHIPRNAIHIFLGSLHARLQPGATVILLDNRYVEGSSTAIARQTAEGDTFQRRTLADGSVHEVLKNFPTEDELRLQLGTHTGQVEYNSFKYYWFVEYRVLHNNRLEPQRRE